MGRVLLDFFLRLELARLAFEHHRNAVADAKRQAVGLANKLLLGFAKNQRALAKRADENFKQAGVHESVSK